MKWAKKPKPLPMSVIGHIDVTAVTTRNFDPREHGREVVAAVEVDQRATLRRRGAVAVHDGATHRIGTGGKKTHGRRPHGHGLDGAPEHRLVEGFGAGEMGDGNLEPADGVRTCRHGALLRVAGQKLCIVATHRSTRPTATECKP